MRKTSKYQSIAAVYRHKIRSGELGPGENLPSLLDGMQLHGVTKNTIIAAYKMLKDEGLIESHPGRETKVFDPKKLIYISLPADLLGRVGIKAEQDGMESQEWLTRTIEELVRDCHE